MNLLEISTIWLQICTTGDGRMSETSLEAEKQKILIQKKMKMPMAPKNGSRGERGVPKQHTGQTKTKTSGVKGEAGGWGLCELYKPRRTWASYWPARPGAHQHCYSSDAATRHVGSDLVTNLPR